MEFGKTFYLAVLIMGGVLLSACGNSDKTQQSEEKIQNEQINEDSSQEFSLLEILDEPNNWEDDQIHDINWSRFLQLLQDGADINQKDEQGNSILKRVITSPIPNTIGAEQEALARAKVVEILLKRGATLDSATDNEGNTALIYASSNGYFPVVEVLLKYSADVNATNNLGNTSLIAAVSPHILWEIGFPPTQRISFEGHLKTVQLLLDAGAKVNVRNKKGMTALMEAKNSHDEWNDGETIRSADENEVRLQIINLLKTAGAEE